MKAHAAPVICFWSLAYDSLEVRGAVECTIGRTMAGAGTAKTGAAGGGRNAVRRRFHVLALYRAAVHKCPCPAARAAD